MRTVIYRPGALGDTLLTFPALHLIRRQWPDAQITLICRADVHALARASDLADSTFRHDLSAWACLFDESAIPSELARETFAGADLALVWSLDSGGMIVSRLRALGALRSLVVQPPPQAGSQRHVALQLMDPLAPLGLAIPKDLAGIATYLPTVRWPPAAQDEADAELRRLRAELAGRLPIAIHPGSGGARKIWPPSHFATLIRELKKDFAPLLVAGPQEEKIVAQVIGAADATPIVHELSLAGLAAFLSACALYVGNDSGATHLAGMLGVPTIALFGPTDPALWAPLGQHAVVSQSPTRRIEDLPSEMAVAAIQQILRGT